MTLAAGSGGAAGLSAGTYRRTARHTSFILSKFRMHQPKRSLSKLSHAASSPSGVIPPASTSSRLSSAMVHNAVLSCQAVIMPRRP